MQPNLFLIVFWLLTIFSPVVDHLMFANRISGSSPSSILLLSRPPPILLLSESPPVPPLPDSSPHNFFESYFFELNFSELLYHFYMWIDGLVTHPKVLAYIPSNPFEGLDACDSTICLIFIIVGLLEIHARLTSRGSTTPVGISPSTSPASRSSLFDYCSSATANFAVVPSTWIDAKTGAGDTSKINGELVEGKTLEPAGSTDLTVAAETCATETLPAGTTTYQPAPLSPEGKRWLKKLYVRLKKMQDRGDFYGRVYDNWSDESDGDAPAPAPTPDSCEVPSTTASQDSLYGELGKMVGAPRVRLPVIIPVKGGMPPPPGMTMIGLGRERSWVRDSRIRA